MGITNTEIEACRFKLKSFDANGKFSGGIKCLSDHKLPI
jgi:hypothetical protein